MNLRLLLDGLDRWIYPRTCLGCGNPPVTGRDEAKANFLCQPCQSNLKPTVPPYCQRCGESFNSADDHLICYNCHQRHLHFNYAFSPFLAEGVMLDLIHHLKYGKQQFVAPLLARLLAEGLKEPRYAALPPALSVLIPVPLHPAKERERQFNQSVELAHQLSLLTHIPLAHGLRRTSFTQAQARLSRADRLTNVKNAFHWTPSPKWTADFYNTRTAILIDDVFTTGATTDGCALALTRAGFRQIVVLTVARG